MVEEESHTSNLTQRVKTLLNVHDPVEEDNLRVRLYLIWWQCGFITPEQAADDSRNQSHKALPVRFHTP